jgi:hypothetical protein
MALKALHSYVPCTARAAVTTAAAASVPGRCFDAVMYTLQRVPLNETLAMLAAQRLADFAHTLDGQSQLCVSLQPLIACISDNTGGHVVRTAALRLLMAYPSPCPTFNALLPSIVQGTITELLQLSALEYHHTVRGDGWKDGVPRAVATDCETSSGSVVNPYTLPTVGLTTPTRGQPSVCPVNSQSVLLLSPALAQLCTVPRHMSSPTEDVWITWLLWAGRHGSLLDTVPIPAAVNTHCERTCKATVQLLHTITPVVHRYAGACMSGSL